MADSATKIKYYTKQIEEITEKVIVLNRKKREIARKLALEKTKLKTVLERKNITAFQGVNIKECDVKKPAIRLPKKEVEKRIENELQNIGVKPSKTIVDKFMNIRKIE